MREAPATAPAMVSAGVGGLAPALPVPLELYLRKSPEMATTRLGAPWSER